MMRLDFGLSSRRVWIWRAELPDAQYEPVQVMSLRVPTDAQVSATASQAAAELRQIAGPHSYYGLLGAEFVPNGTAELAIEVATSSVDIPGDGDRCWNRPGSSRWTGEYIGLPQEHGRAVLEAARDAPYVAQLGSGTLRFDRAAYHHIDSNDFTYARLAQIVVRLLLPNAVTLSESDLVEFVREVMRY